MEEVRPQARTQAFPIQQTLKRGFLSIGLRAAFVALGVFLLLWQPSAPWIETAYSNGAYPQWERVAFAIANPVPWSMGDVAGLIGVAAIAWRVAGFFRNRKRTLAMLAIALLDVAAILGLYAAWFELSWGWNYARAPVETRVAFDAKRVTPQAADALRTRAMHEMNVLAPLAHAHAKDALNLATLQRYWLPVVQRAGDDWTPLAGPAKPTITDPFMQATGTSGYINPLSLTVQTASDLLWFERPFDMAHEWTHVAAYAREDEANYAAIVTCLRSNDPAIRYSGWFELFLYLPQKTRYRRSDFVPLVWQDFAAIRRRDARHINVLLAHWTWRTYNVYLKSNRIASGIENYNEVTRLILGVPLDREGLPVAK
ncbi:MAG TPA: DUF3810 family protein [Candidatus Baltobacteraceae bacterium]|nr:DUF3810 family protein [Candidatus Baltobacteraceae bacterium]